MRGAVLDAEERALSGQLFAPGTPELVTKKTRAHRLSHEFNDLFEEDAEACQAILEQLLAEIGEGSRMLGPIQFHYGVHTKVGRNCFMNFNFVVQDDARGHHR